ncbi:sulfotransferase [Halomonas sp. SL1]|uniref:sulfotransferase family protein n=1 Tax=Halomonas sp. SL1 TaxID=2137478 RepID=UPI000D171C8C|nr:sulfotransferase [Halomonas sp. SL1]RAH36585.1 sulfotransferase [Halomonas sp. SL1]
MSYMPAVSAPDVQPIFVIGCWRSGTTILAKLLDNHPRLSWLGWEMNDEWEKFGDIKGRAFENPYQDGREVDGQTSCRMASLFYQELLKKYVIEKKGKLSLNEMFEYPQEVIPLNKSPNLMNKVEHVKRVFPGAKFVLIVRDVFSFSNAYYKHSRDLVWRQRGLLTYWPTEGGVNIEREGGVKRFVSAKPEEMKNIPEDQVVQNDSGYKRIPEAWLKLNAGAIHSLIKVAEEDFVAIRFEDLMSHPQRVLSRVASVLGLENVPIDTPDNLLDVKIPYNYTNTKGDATKVHLDEMSSFQLKCVEQEVSERRELYEFIENNLASVS